ncbi:hypothetical protein D9M70_542790 [compost metagenome]
MDARVVTGLAQRHAVTQPAGDAEFLQRRALGKLRQTNALAGHARPLVGEGDFHLGIARDRSDAAGKRPLERFGSILARGWLCLRVRAHESSFFSQMR